MAKGILHDVYLTIAGTDLSDCVDGIEFARLKDEVEATPANAKDKEYIIDTLKGAQFSVNFFQDFAASKVHAIINAAYENTSAVAVVLRFSDAAASATNPEFQFNVTATNYPVVSGSKGAQALMSNVQFVVTGAITVATS